MSNNEHFPVQYPLPEGVYDSFTYSCILCGVTVTVVKSTAQSHECKVPEQVRAYYAGADEVTGFPRSAYRKRRMG